MNDAQQHAEAFNVRVRIDVLEAENRRLREHIAALEKEARKLVTQIEHLAETIETLERNREGMR